MAKKAGQAQDQTLVDLTGDPDDSKNPCLTSLFKVCGDTHNPMTVDQAKAEIQRRHDDEYGKVAKSLRPKMQAQKESPEDVARFFYNDPKTIAKDLMRAHGLQHETYRISGKSGASAVVGTIVCGPCCDPTTGLTRIECTVK